MPVRFREQAVDVNPFPAGPPLDVIDGAEDWNDEVGLLAVEHGQTDAKIVDRELGLVVFVIKNGRFAETIGNDARDPFHKVPLFPRKGEGDAETFAGIAHEVMSSVPARCAHGESKNKPRVAA